MFPSPGFPGQTPECPCGYVYDPKAGDPENGIEPGVEWDDLPDDWTCPQCGREKDEFEDLMMTFMFIEEIVDKF